MQHIYTKIILPYKIFFQILKILILFLNIYTYHYFVCADTVSLK
jgi:hypothetical protein